MAVMMSLALRLAREFFGSGFRKRSRLSVNSSDFMGTGFINLRPPVWAEVWRDSNGEALPW